MRLYLLRHGNAVESSYYQDSQRPLSERGKQEIQIVARFLERSRTSLELVLASPLVRTQETAQILQEALHINDVLTSESLIPGNNLRNLIAEINAHEVGSLILVGHEPQLSGAISLLTAGDEQFRVEMKKGSLACLESELPAKKGNAVLTWLLNNSQMDLLR